MDNKPGAKRLKKDAVPTKFSFLQPTPKRKSSTERSERISFYTLEYRISGGGGGGVGISGWVGKILKIIKRGLE